LGVAQLGDGLVALPLDSRNREQLEWLADEVSEAGGEGSIWIGEPATLGQERDLATALQSEIASQYRAVVAEARAAAADGRRRHRRTLARLRRELERIRSRDYFPPSEREEAKRAVEALAQQLEEDAA
jgi:hypothetical protein